MPPKISDLPAKSPPLEVLPPELPRPGTAARAADGPPIHALSALVLLAVDNLWNLAEWVVLDWIITVPLSFVTVFVPVFLGVLAAIPASVTGTPVGIALLAWTGFSKLLGKSPAK